MQDNDPLIDLVSRAGAHDDVYARPAVVAAVVDLAEATVVEAERQPRTASPARRRRWLTALVAALVLVPTAAAVGGLTARTGLFGNPAYTEEDGTEWLRMDASDFGTVAAGLVPDVPLPRGASWKTEIDRLVALGRREPALMQETGVRGTLESYARCAWLKAWHARAVAGDEAGAARALAVLDESVTWPATVATDGGGVRDYHRRINTAARGGDTAAVERELALNCAGFRLGGVR